MITSWVPSIVVGALTGAATIFGGSVALRFRSALGLFLGFSSGAVIGVALFDLLPEALDLGRSTFQPLTITTATAVGFAIYLALDRLSLAATSGEGGHRGHLGPASLTVHSLMDGLGIGLAFQISSAVGLVVALAVLAHDFLDGANTVALSLAGGASAPTTRRWLLADAVAPLCGIVLGRLVLVPPATLAILLATFGGFFLYIGASELLPRSHRTQPQSWTMLATPAGMFLIYLVVRISSF